MDVACIVCLLIANQSDFIEHFAKEDIIALRTAEMFPEEEEGNDKTKMSWDYSNEFRCGNLSVYLEVHCIDDEDEMELARRNQLSSRLCGKTY